VSLRLEMLQVARLAPALLEDAARPLADFLRAQFLPEGGVGDRAGKPDLYYAVFALEGLLALREAAPDVSAWLDAFGDGDGLDPVHLCCLARCRASAGRKDRDPGALARRILGHRAADGAFAAGPGEARGTLYHSFLALGALQDLGAEAPGTAPLVAAVNALRLPDGAFANDPQIPAGVTPTTAAGLTLLRHLQAPLPPASIDWLLARRHEKGGFVAAPGAPIPDLLSTATALHALAGAHVELGGLKEPTLDFIDSLWTGRGFCGNWSDDVVDPEYTYYALLALGHLSLA
jgi:prenyltransferase beta subunit